jgi:hypothetical protein
MTMVQVSPQRLLLSGWLLTNVQVNITTAIYDIGHTLIHITLLLLFMLFFTLLPFSLAGWLSSIPFFRYRSEFLSFSRNHSCVYFVFALNKVDHVTHVSLMTGLSMVVTI